VIEEDLAVQVVGLVLEDPSEQTPSLYFHFLTVFVIGDESD
jgi:hypothetical protein